jgi:acetolactate synthase I/II/III large subunit
MTAPDTAFVDWLAGRFHRAGTRLMFGVPGGGTSLDLIDAARRHGIRMVLTAREDAAVIMAGVAAVLSNAPGLAFSTKGPGLASATNGIASAALDRMPVLLMAETFGPGETDYVSHQVFDQHALVAPLLGAAEGSVLKASAGAVEEWLSRNPKPARIPAVMFPTPSSLRQAIGSALDEVAEPVAAAPASASAQAAAQLASEARDPVIIIGLEAAQESLEAPIRALVEHLNAPALTTYMASGMIPHDHPNNAGTFTGGAIEQACVGAADLIITIGLDPVELIRKPWTYDAPILDLCEIAREPHYFNPLLRLIGDLPDTLTGLLAGTAPFPGQSTWTAGRIQTHRDNFIEGLRIENANGMSPSAVVDTAAAAFAGKPRLAVDAGAHMFSACAYWPASRARDILISNGLASMGFAMPAGIAAALHDPERGAVAMTGDGGAMMCLGELKTAAHTGANVCFIIFNDGRLSLIDIKREERQMPDLGLNWERPDFAAIAAGFGIKSWTAETIEEMADASHQAAGQDGPRLIDARVGSGGYFDQMKALRG